MYQTKPKYGFGFTKFLLTINISVMVAILSVAAMYETPPAYRVPIFAATLGLLMVLSAGRLGTFSREKLLMLLLWMGFGAIVLVSSMNNKEDLMAALWVFLGVPYLAFCVFPQAAGRYGKVMVLAAIVLAFVPYIVASLVLYPLVSPFLGVFINSNLFGMIVTTIAASLFALLRGVIPLSKKNVFHWVWIIILSSALIVAFILIIKSRSRTSLITYAVSSMIFLWSMFIDFKKNRLWIALSLVIIIGAASFFAYSVLTGDVQIRYLKGIVSKMEAKIDAQDPFSGRFEIWKSVLRDIKFFGYGALNFPTHYGANAHNTYIMVLGALGPAALVLIFAIHGMAIFLSLRLVLRNIREDGYALGPFLIIMNYITLGMAELVFGILGNGIHMSFLLMLGVLINERISGEQDFQLIQDDKFQSTLPSMQGSELQ